MFTENQEAVHITIRHARLVLLSLVHKKCIQCSFPSVLKAVIRWKAIMISIVLDLQILMDGARIEHAADCEASFF